MCRLSCGPARSVRALYASALTTATGASRGNYLATAVRPTAPQEHRTGRGPIPCRSDT